MIDDVEELVVPAVALASYASGWIVTHTAVPAGWRGYVSSALVGVGALAFIGGVRALGGDLTPSRCAAAKADGSRCTRDAESPFGDLCWQHRDLYDVEIHPSAVDGVTGVDEIEELAADEPRTD